MHFIVAIVAGAVALSWSFGWEHFGFFLALSSAAIIVIGIAVVVSSVMASRAKSRQERLLHQEQERQKKRTLESWKLKAESQREALLLRYRQIVAKNPYGSVDLKPWRKELSRFREAVGISGDNKLVDYFDILLTADVKTWAEEADRMSTTSEFISTDPYEYERWCAQVLRTHGWEAFATKASGDQGVDIIATKGNIKIAIQCKLYTGSVGNKAIQEVHAAAAYVDARHAAVVAPTEYTPAARQLAGKLGVHLLHHSQLSGLERLLYREGPIS